MREPQPGDFRPPDRPSPDGGGFDDGDGPDFRDFENDRGLLVVVSIIVGLGALIALLVLAPIPGFDFGGGDGGISTDAREVLPPVPEGLVALSDLHDINVGNGFEGAATLTVRLTKSVTEDDSLAFYTYEGDEWRRLVSVQLIDGNRAAQGTVQTLPQNIAVLERETLASALALIIGSGDTPDPDALRGASIVAVDAGRPASSDGAVLVQPGALDAALAAGVPTYLGFSAEAGDDAQAVDLVLATPALVEQHVASIAAAAQEFGAAGVHINYTAVDAARRAQFTSFIESLATQLQAGGLGLVVSVPTPVGVDFGAYEWVPLAAAADGLWMRGPGDRSVYYDQIGAALATQRERGTDLGAVSLVVDRRSSERSADGVRALSQRDALAIASELAARSEGGIAPGDGVTVNGTNIDQTSGNSGLAWDDRSRSVTFSYVGRGGPRTVWVENRFSVAFRLDLARLEGLGGVVIDGAEQDDALPNVWEAVRAFAEEGTARLELPYGPYLMPLWSVSDGLVEGSSGDGVIVWRAPEQTGAYEITLVVSDGETFVGQQVSLLVRDEEEPPVSSAPDPADDDDAEAVGPPPDDDGADGTADGTSDGTGDGTDDGTADGAGDGTADGSDSGDDQTDNAAPTEEPAAEATEEPATEPTEEPTQEGPPGPAGN